jgi:hypothetical protein
MENEISIREQLVAPEFLSRDDPVLAFQDRVRNDVNKHLGAMELSYRDSVLGLTYVLAEVISHHPSKATRTVVALRLNEVIIPLADEIAALRENGMLSRRH